MQKFIDGLAGCHAINGLVEIPNRKAFADKNGRSILDAVHDIDGFHIFVGA
jgi:hypothetical protein